MNRAKLSAVVGSGANGSSMTASSTRTMRSSGIPVGPKPLIDVVFRIPLPDASNLPNVSIVVDLAITPVSFATTSAGPVAVSTTESFPECKNFELRIRLY